MKIDKVESKMITASTKDARENSYGGNRTVLSVTRSWVGEYESWGNKNTMASFVRTLDPTKHTKVHNTRRIVP